MVDLKSGISYHTDRRMTPQIARFLDSSDNDKEIATVPRSLDQLRTELLHVGLCELARGEYVQDVGRGLVWDGERVRMFYTRVHCYTIILLRVQFV